LDFAAGFIIASLLPYNLAYPAVMIPAFLAPLSLDFHGLSLRQLMAQSATTGKRICRLARRPPPEQSSATTVGAA
jgi:hypothetical protein